MANQKITDLVALQAVSASLSDLTVVVDVNDLSSPTGETKKMELGELSKIINQEWTSSLVVKDEGTSITEHATSLDFVGNAVSASVTGTAITITVNTGSAGDFSTGSFTGSFAGNGSLLTNIVSASNAVTASYSLSTTSTNAVTASYAVSASRAESAGSSVLATTATSALTSNSSLTSLSASSALTAISSSNAVSASYAISAGSVGSLLQITSSASGSTIGYTWVNILSLATTISNGSVVVNGQIYVNSTSGVGGAAWARIRDQNSGSVATLTITDYADSGAAPVEYKFNLTLLDNLVGSTKTYFLDIATAGTVTYGGPTGAPMVGPGLVSHGSDGQVHYLKILQNGN